MKFMTNALPGMRKQIKIDNPNKSQCEKFLKQKLFHITLYSTDIIAHI